MLELDLITQITTFDN